MSEIYASVQGEGLLTGTPSTFVRTSGCNLRCWFCDTRFASWEPEGDYLQTSEIVQQVKRFDHDHVVLTGGEPMIFAHVGELARAIVDLGKHLTIETAGTIYRDVPCSLYSISPKLSSSTPQNAGSWTRLHELRRESLEVVEQMMQLPYQLKFVIDSPSDVEEVEQYLTRLSNFDPERVLLMPQGTTAEQLSRVEEWLSACCEQKGFTYCPRQHIEWFGNRRGT